MLAHVSVVALTLAAEPGLSYQAYLAQAREAFEASPQAAQNDRTAAAQRTSQEATLLQSPVTVSGSLGANAYQPLPATGLPAFHEVFGGTAEATLSYRDRSSFQTSLTTRGSASLLQQPSTGGATNVPLSVSLRASYDLIQGGESSAEWLGARASNRRAEQQLLQLRQDRMEARLGLLRLATEAAAAKCRLAILADVEGRILETVKTGELELKTRVLSQKDFLNYTSLEQSFRSQQAAQRSALVTSERALESFGDAGRSVLALLPRVRCQVNAPVLPPDWGDAAVVDGLARNQPSVRSVDALRESLAIDVEAAHLANRAALGPYIAGTYATTGVGAPPLGSVSAGMSLQWNVPMRRGALNAQAVEENAQSIGAYTTRVHQETRSQLLRNFEQVRAQAGVVTALLASEANANKLLTVIAAQKAIGQIDSLNFTSAYLSRIQAALAALDAWATLHNSFNDLRERALVTEAPLPAGWTQPFAAP